MTPHEPADTLDPADWTATLALAHRMVEAAAVQIRDVRDRPVWQPMPETVRQSYADPPPQDPAPLTAIWQDLQANLLPYAMGNSHPRFWMWYMGAGTFTGALGEFLAAIDGSNLGAGNTAAALMDRQVTGWLRELMGFPPGASGTLVDGGSMANIIGLTVARNVMAGVDVREHGVAAIAAPLRFYTSDQVHSCHQKAIELLGLGNRALVRVPSDDACRIDLDALAKAIADDRAAGLKPACVIATAGTTNTGAIDDLGAIRDLCRREGLWFHVDGCIGDWCGSHPCITTLWQGSRTRIPWRWTCTNGFTPRSRPAWRWCATGRSILGPLRCIPNIWKKSPAVSRRPSICTTSACKPVGGSGRSSCGCC